MIELVDKMIFVMVVDGIVLIVVDFWVDWCGFCKM